MRFRFRLQKLLEYRRRREDEARVELRRQEQAVHAAAAALARARERRAELDARYRGEDSGPVTALALKGRLARTQLLIVTEGMACAQLEAAKDGRERAREAVLRVHRQKRVLERLRERRLAQHEQEIRAQERREADDQGGRRRGPRPDATATPARGPR